MRAIPTELLGRPFTRAEGLAAGLTPRVLEGGRFVRLHTGVYRHRDLAPTYDVLLAAARLALPRTARATGMTRLRALGLRLGPELPLHFVVAGDLHLDLQGVRLHRTVVMPACDDLDVSVEAAFLAACAELRVIDAIQVGDWLLHRGHVTEESIRELAGADHWRWGAQEALWVLQHLDGRSRSLPESETRALIVFSGLPAPEVNVSIGLEVEPDIVPDLWYADFAVAVEYEGSHHQEERDQYGSDIDRYAVMRRVGADYVQVTKEKLRSPRSVVGAVFRKLVERGFEGPPPDFGARWRQLFRPLAEVVPSRTRPPVLEPHSA